MIGGMLYEADRDVLGDAVLVTGRYRDFRPGMGVPVRTTRSFPRGWRQSEQGDLIVFASTIVPWKEWKMPGRTGLPSYLERLDRTGNNVIGQLADIVTRYQGQRICLLCFEDVHAEGDKGECHRRWFADWFETQTGLVIPEMVTA